MTLSTPQIAAALDAIAEDIEKADSSYEESMHRSDAWAYGSATWRIQLAYSKLLALCEILQLPHFRADIAATLELVKENPGEDEDDPDGESHLKWAAPARRYQETLQSILLTDGSQTVTKDLEAIIRDSLYVITDPLIYQVPPQNEDHVHLRIQGILRCVFPDLLKKPSLSKPIKNFIPDTGIPSIKTVIEYKFVSEQSQVGPTADQILADTLGYKSERWESFLYVIYETERFKPEAEWRQLLRECGTAENTSVVVLSGASLRTPNEKPKLARGRPRKTAARNPTRS
jgi:hypothetical protein